MDTIEDTKEDDFVLGETYSVLDETCDACQQLPSTVITKSLARWRTEKYKLSTENHNRKDYEQYQPSH